MITFPEGLPGFEKSRQFILLQPDGLEPLLLLQTIEGDSLHLPVIPVEALRDDYELAVGDEDRRLLELDDEPRLGHNVLCLGVLVLNSDPPTCNLMAPIVINPHRRKAKQILQSHGGYPSAWPLPPE